MLGRGVGGQQKPPRVAGTIGSVIDIKNLVFGLLVSVLRLSYDIILFHFFSVLLNKLQKKEIHF